MRYFTISSPLAQKLLSLIQFTWMRLTFTIIWQEFSSSINITIKDRLTATGEATRKSCHSRSNHKSCISDGEFEEKEQLKLKSTHGIHQVSSSNSNSSYPLHYIHFHFR